MARTNFFLLISGAFLFAFNGIMRGLSVMTVSSSERIQENSEILVTKKNPIPTKQNLVISEPDTWIGETESRGKGHQKTETGIDLTDPDLYSGVDFKGDSSTATVMGMATGYDLYTFHQFVGTLRKSGFKGNIILGVEPTVSKEILAYFKLRNVTPKIMKWVNCTYPGEKRKCSHPYPDIKIRWSRFPLQRDWLRDCETCTGPVLITDVRDAFFQLDPFGTGSPIVNGLQVFQEHKNQTTDHWLTRNPIIKCKGVGAFAANKPMLCSGTTVGTRKAMLKYLEIMYAEMKHWISIPKCHFKKDGDDQSIHNYLYYSGQLPFATSVVNRAGGIVNTVGFEGSFTRRKHVNIKKKLGISKADAMKMPYEGSVWNTGDGKRWIGEKYNISDDEGWFTEADGSKSRVVHQWDRFGKPYIKWMNKQSYFQDS